MSTRKTKKLNTSDQMMQEVIGYAGCLFTRFRLLQELTARGYSAPDIDLHVFGPGWAFDLGVSNPFNETPNEIPAWFWPAIEDARKA